MSGTTSGVNFANQKGKDSALATFLADGKGGFAGLCGFCSWLPLAEAVQACVDTEDKHDRLTAMRRVYDGSSVGKTNVRSLTETPILLEHARDDEVVPVINGRYMRDMLVRLGFENVVWREYEDGGHWVHEPEGVDDLYAFFLKAMGDSREGS